MTIAPTSDTATSQTATSDTAATGIDRSGQRSDAEFETEVDTEVDDAVDGADAELASRLRLAVTRLHRRLRQQAAGGLTQSQGSALASIGQLGSPTLGALAARESVQPPSMTRIVAALEEMGHVARVVDPADRRVARVTLTESGREVLHRSRSLKNAFLAEQLKRLSPDERRSLGELTVLLERLVAPEEP